MRVRTIPAAFAGGLALAVAAATAAASPAAADVPGGGALVVGPGQSIQAAVDAAAAGDTVVVRGSHAENVLVTKPLTLRGEAGARLSPPAQPRHNRCTDDEDVPGGFVQVGVCVLGVLGAPVDPTGDLPAVITPVAGVRLVDLAIEGFGEGIEADGTDGLAVRDVTLRDDADGIDSFYGTGTVLAGVRITGATGLAGAHLVRSRDVRVTGGDFSGNGGLGLSLDDTDGGEVSGNSFTGNSGGMAVVDTAAPGPAGDLRITGNAVLGNTGFFPGDGAAPPLSGVGIALLGATDVRVSGNRISGNTPSGPAAFAGFGIGLLDASALTGGAAPTRNRITGNDISGSPVPVLYDGSGTDNVVRGNHVR